MTKTDDILGLTGGAGDQALVERALGEFRSGRPVAILAEGKAVLVCGVEAFDLPLSQGLHRLAKGTPRLVLPAARLRRLGLDRKVPGSVAMPRLDVARIEMLAIVIDARIDAPVAPTDAFDAAALELARLALTVPAVIVVPVDPSVL
ncbi:MAG: GTP cyclohydrolase, partial [Alphaproteobacteria bacterium]